MFKSVNALLRERLDPNRTLPYVQLITDQGERVRGLTCYRAFAQHRNIGELLVRREKPEVGKGTLSIEGVRMRPFPDSGTFRKALELALITRSSTDNRVLVSGRHGVSAEESAMWHRLSEVGLATIVEPFTPRAEPIHGEAIFDGIAFALPMDPQDAIPGSSAATSIDLGQYRAYTGRQ